jgi:hypothetical protein
MAVRLSVLRTGRPLPTQEDTFAIGQKKVWIIENSDLATFHCMYILLHLVKLFYWLSLQRIELDKLLQFNYLVLCILQIYIFACMCVSQKQRLKYITKCGILSLPFRLPIIREFKHFSTVIKPIWTYGLELWGCASKANIAIIQRAQSKTLRSITNAPWYVSNLTLHKDLKTPYVTETIRENNTKHDNKLENHSTPLLHPLLQPHENRRFKRNWPADLRNWGKRHWMFTHTRHEACTINCC